MAHAAAQTEPDARITLELLESRLRRVEFLVTGASLLDGLPEHATRPQNTDESIIGRLRSLQHRMDRIRKDSSLAGEMIRDLESLYSRYPELRKDHTSIPDEDMSSKASFVLANATLYPETASRLSSLQTLQIPPIESSSMLGGLNSEIEKTRQVQNELDHQVQELQQRSAQCLEWWIKTGVVGMGDLWEEWEVRMTEVQRQLGRFERHHKEQEGYM